MFFFLENDNFVLRHNLSLSLHLAEPLLLVYVHSLQTAFHLSWTSAITLTPFHSIPHSIRIFCIPSFHVCQGLLLGLFSSVLACQAILGCLSSPILTIFLNHLNLANSVVPLRGLIPNPILNVSFLILSLLVSLF